jgi:hypothetical protein
MLKISVAETRTQRRLVLEGQLAGRCITELKTICAPLMAELEGRVLVIDIRDVVLISQEGENIILQLLNQGAKLIPQGVLVKCVLQQLAHRSKKRVSDLIDESPQSGREESTTLLHPRRRSGRVAIRTDHL